MVWGSRTVYSLPLHAVNHHSGVPTTSPNSALPLALHSPVSFHQHHPSHIITNRLTTYLTFYHTCPRPPHPLPSSPHFIFTDIPSSTLSCLSNVSSDTGVSPSTMHHIMIHM